MRLGNLGTKFSLLLALIWLVGGSVTIFTLSKHLNDQAEQTVRERAEIVLTAMQAARDYTQDNIQPLVEAYSVADNSFTQEIIPNF
ncbi:MAG: histidine kinase, partial [Cyanobacteria bacterium J06576_12]